jgi:uroporphyrin-III C-methyltransferase/precorrin-2 dehydrogenase/sirohydrochlorin ferrochelatase
MTYHVPPMETRPARLAALPKLPIFLDLQDRQIVIIGGGEAVAWKAELLAASGAKVSVYASDVCAELSVLVDTIDSLTHVSREWRETDLDDAWLVIADCADPEEAARLSAAARSRGVLVNVIDQPGYCDFQFGTIVNRAPVVIGISTDGAAPILGQAIRRRIEAVLPRSIGSWARAAKEFRVQLKTLVPSREGRRRFWEKFVDVTFVSQADEDARLAELERIAHEILRERTEPKTGEVIIVGAGPGDPELLTMKAVRELQAADVIVYDRLVTADILELGRREARRILVGKEGHGAACRQDDINALLVRLAREGKRVVRLKGGDPAVFGRTSEEVEACRAAHVGARIVPGITAASAAAAVLGISLTHRSHAQRVQFVTGHDRNGELPRDLDLDALADPRATTVVYMGGRTMTELARKLIARGLSGSTPAAVVSNASKSGENRIHVTLAQLATEPTQLDQSGPILILIGEALRETLDPKVRERAVETESSARQGSSLPLRGGMSRA